MPDEQRDQTVTTSPRYDEDFYAWTQHQATVLRGVLWPEELDALHLAEEINDLGKSHRRELRSRLRVLGMHLLTWRYQPEGRRDSHSWEESMREQRKEIEDALEDSPSLRQEVGPHLRVMQFSVLRLTTPPAPSGRTAVRPDTASWSTRWRFAHAL